jgi:hypothetical protein
LGHVGLALGDGLRIHVLGRVRIDPIADAWDLPVLEGWTPPVYVGWAGPRRILTGACERAWGRT